MTDIIDKNRRMTLEEFKNLTESESDIIRKNIHKAIHEFFNGSVEKIKDDDSIPKWPR